MSFSPSTRGAPDRRLLGAVVGVVLGLMAGCLLVTIWLSSLEVGFAVTVVFTGLVVCFLWGVPGWRRFGVALLGGALGAAAVYGAVLYYGPFTGS